MNNEELYNRTVDILYNAYFNDTLEHGDCAKCAIGNLVSHYKNYKVIALYTWQAPNGKAITPDWVDVFATDSFGESHFSLNDYNGRAKKEIDCTGYSIYEAADIERAFETADKGNSGEDWMFNGLVAVLEVLKTIHNIDDNSEVIIKFNEVNTRRKKECVNN